MTSPTSLILLTCLAVFSLQNRGAAADEAPARQTHNVMLVTLDGLRWQEVFSGAEESLIDGESGGVKEVEAVRERYWRDTPDERRARLMPFFWETIATHGRVFGNPEQRSIARVTNGLNFSYPGYNEILTGRADPRIDSNDKRPNPNVTVLEWLHAKEGYRGRVAAFCSWDVFPFIINDRRSGIPVNAGWQRLAGDGDAAALAELDRLSDELPRYWHNVRYDYFTFCGALACLRESRPRVLYVSLGETDDWAHARRYDLYLDAAQRNDRYLRELWTAVQTLPEYANRTSLVVTTDHGRGETRADWISHGKDVPGSDQIWIAVLGPDTVPGAAPEGPATQSQVAATLAALLGEDFQAAHPESGAALRTVTGGR
jgi:hypothetical protein